MKKSEIALLPQETIESKIFFLRGKRVMLDRDLAILYGVETRALNQAVRRNMRRFPEDFMFQLTKEEMESWKSQIVISNREKMGLRRRPYAFTEQGVAMLSSVLNSDRAIQVNIQIMRTFTKLREMLMAHKDLKRKIEDMEKKYYYQFKIVFDAIKQLLEPPTEPKGKMGFRALKKI
ncbi:MAG: ORF6N domain-containing protein [Planctomycetes bacterium]|nr:ORF6N domain-containing protein [Planctomycetota bacterium]